MNRVFMVCLAVCAIALGGGAYYEWQESSRAKTDLAAARAAFDAQAQQLKDLDAERKTAEDQLQVLREQLDSLAAKLEAQKKLLAERKAAPAAATAPAAAKADASSKSPMGNMLAKMMDDPDMKKMMRDQQRTAIARRNAALYKQLNLTPEEADKFTNLLVDNQMKQTEQGMSLMNTDLSTNRTELYNSVKTMQQSADDSVKAFLGDDRYTQYKDYQQAAADRAQLKALQQSIGDDATPLTTDQGNQLMAIMKEEKQNAKTSGVSLPGNNQDPANLDAIFDPNAMDKLLQSQQAVNEQVYARARSILTQDQLDALAKSQASQLEQMRTGLIMARKFMTPDKSSAAPAPPVQ